MCPYCYLIDIKTVQEVNPQYYHAIILKLLQTIQSIVVYLLHTITHIMINEC